MKVFLLAVTLISSVLYAQTSQATECTTRDCDTVDLAIANFEITNQQVSFDVLVMPKSPIRMGGMSLRIDMPANQHHTSSVDQEMLSDNTESTYFDNEVFNYGFFKFSGSDQLACPNTWYLAGRVTINHGGNLDLNDWSINKLREEFPSSAVTKWVNFNNQPAVFIEEAEIITGSTVAYKIAAETTPRERLICKRAAVQVDADDIDIEITRLGIQVDDFAQDGEIKVFNAQGQLVFTQSVQVEDVVHIDRTNWSKGLYILHFHNGVTTNTVKMNL